MRYLLLIIGVLALAGCGKKDCSKTGSAKIQTTSESGADSESKAEIVPITAEEAADIIDNESDFTMGEFFPNPAKEYTTINYKSGKNSHLKIIDILGNKVKDIHLSNIGMQDIYVGDLSKGVYFGNLVHNDKVITVKKLIIK